MLVKHPTISETENLRRLEKQILSTYHDKNRDQLNYKGDKQMKSTF